MVKLPAGLQFLRLPRVAVYAILAALVTTALFAADGAYRWYRGAGETVTVTSTGARSDEANEPAPVRTQQASPAPQVAPPTPEPVIAGSQKPAEERQAPTLAASPPSGPLANPAGEPVANEAAAPNAGPAISPVARPTENPVPAPASRSVEVAPVQEQPKSLPQRGQRVRRPPAKQAVRDRATTRRPVRAAKPAVRTEKPNVYWERDSQLGFAPQLRKRTCNPATGQMPMQCYYPREGREKFPAKPLN